MSPHWIKLHILRVTSIWSLLMTTTVFTEETNRCLYGPTEYLPFSCSQDQMLFIIKVFIAKTESTFEATFCESPYHGVACEQNMEMLTEACRKECNTFSYCKLALPPPPTDTCGPNYNGQVYVHAEYSCMQRRVNEDVTPVWNACARVQHEEITHRSFLFSADYPGGWQSASDCMCTVQLRDNIIVTIHVLELTHNASLASQDCPFSLIIRFGQTAEQICARKAVSISPRSFGPYFMREDQIELITIEFGPWIRNVGGRFWVEISAHHTLEGPTRTVLTCRQRGVQFTMPPTQFAVLPPGDANSTESPILDDRTNISSVDHPAPAQPKRLEPDLRIIIGGAVAGALVVVLLVILLAVCIERKRHRVKKESDLAYICHANMAAASKLVASQASLRHLPKVRKQPSLQLSDQPPLGAGVAPHHSGARRGPSKAASSRGHAYNNLIVSPEIGQSVESLPAYSTSLTALTPSDDTGPNGRGYRGDLAQPPYEDSDAFSSFPRWSNTPKDQPRDSGGSSDGGSSTQTLPSKFKAPNPGLRAKDFRPKPLPKPKRHTNSTLGSSTQSIVHDSSMDIYAKPHKNRKEGITIVENDFY